MGDAVSKKPSFLFAAIVLVTTLVGAADAPTIVRFDPDGPPGIGLKANGRAQGHVYLRSTDDQRAGVWRADPATSGPHKTTYSEFMYLLEGSVTLIDQDGRQETFKAGDALLVPRGTEYTWKQTEPLRKYYVIFDREPEGGARPTSTEKVTFMRLEPDGPATKGLTGEGRTKSHRYYAGREKSSVGVWETAPHTAADFHTTKYAELMVFLKGSGSLIMPDGREQAFKAGDVVLVPKNVQYKWKSETVRKYWVVFDNEAAGTE